MSAANKQIVRRFNQQVIVAGDRVAFDQLVSPGFINHSAPPGAPNDKESLWQTFALMLRPAISSVQVVIDDQLAEGNKVTSRKRISGLHSGTLLSVPATHSRIEIAVIDIVEIIDGQYAAHWGMNNLAAVVAQLKQA